MTWDPEQYGRFASERSRPFADLVARIGAPAPRRIVDLGCGSGELTGVLARRWPGAVVEGIDSSAEMIAAASADGVTFRVEDVADWDMPDDADLVVSNAVLQWVPTHRELLTKWAATLPPHGWLAFQVPGNYESPSHTTLREIAYSPRWWAALDGVVRNDAVASPEEYAELLLAAGLHADVWETTYLHVLSGPDPVLEWLRGTALRPVIATLPPELYQQFEAELAGALREAYPATPRGTLFPFRRIFAAAHRPA